MMALFITVIVTAFYVILLNGNVTGQRCTPVDYPPFVDRSDEFSRIDPFQVTHPLQFILLSYHFGCKGTITKWELYTVNNGSHPIEFQVWRVDTRVSSTFTLSLVGTNYFSDAMSDSNNLLALPVPPEQQIKVQAGDMVGISTIENNSSTDFRIQDFILQGTVVLYTPESNSRTPSSLPFPSVNARFSPIHFLPVMNITIVPEVGTVGGEQQDDASTQEPTPLPQSTVIATAISAAVLVLLSAVLFITVISCCCINGKRVKNMQQKSHPVFQEHNVELDYNVAYHDGHSNEHQEQSEAYYSLVTEVQGGVSDTRDSYVEIQPNYVDKDK